MNSPDPVSLLREFVIKKKPIKFLGLKGNPVDDLASAATVSFDGIHIPRNAKTLLRKRNAQVNEADLEARYHTLDSLILLIGFREKDNFQYIKAANEAGVNSVAFIEKKSVLDYLTGVSDFNDCLEIPKKTTPEAGENARAPSDTLRREILNTADNTAVANITSRERVIRTKLTILRGPISFKELQKKGLELLSKKGKPSAPPTSSHQRPPSNQKPAENTKTASTSNAKLLSSQRLKPEGDKRSGHVEAHPYNRPRPQPDKKGKPLNPIIVVPAAMTALLTLYNVKEFLENQKYVNSTEKKESEKGAKKPTLVTLKRQRTPNTDPVVYHVVDSVERFKPDDWERIVCVLTNGATWQFRGWKWQSPAEIFHHVKGFYVKYSDDQPKDTVTGWNVGMLNIHRNKRHADKATVSEFWDSLDMYMAAKKPYLLAPH